MLITFSQKRVINCKNTNFVPTYHQIERIWAVGTGNVNSPMVATQGAEQARSKEILVRIVNNKITMTGSLTVHT